MRQAHEVIEQAAQLGANLIIAAGFLLGDTVKKYASRLVASHWKDFDPKMGDPAYAKHGFHGDFVELGKGVVDFHGLADFYRQIGFDGWVQLELDRTREASIAISAQKMKAFVTDQLKLQMVPVSH